MEKVNEIEEVFEVGDRVKFKVELEPGENEFDMVIVELNGDRCFVETKIPNFDLPVISLAKISDLKKSDL